MSVKDCLIINNILKIGYSKFDIECDFLHAVKHHSSEVDIDVWENGSNSLTIELSHIKTTNFSILKETEFTNEVRKILKDVYYKKF